jgi:hypothetical protein
MRHAPAALVFAVVACDGPASELGPAEAPAPARFGDTVFPVVGYGQRAPQAPAVRLVVFLFEDGAAVSFYEEGILGHGFNPTSGGAGPGSVDSRRRVSSSWRVDGSGALEVGDLLTCAHRRWPEPPHPSSAERLLCA